MQAQFDATAIDLVCRAEDLPDIEDLGPERTLHFLRIVQEALTNVIKHSRARSVAVETHPQLTVNGKACVSVTITDDGRGMSAQCHGRGLTHMRFRANATRLELAVQAPFYRQGGTRITIGFPIQVAPAAS